MAQKSYTARLSDEIDAAYEAYKAKEPDADKRLLGAFVEQARNIARFRLKELYDDTVAYDAAHRAMLALKDFQGKSALSTWFYQIAQNESFSELGRVIKKREMEESIDVPVSDREPGKTNVTDIPGHPADQAAALGVAELRSRLPAKQAEVLDLNEQGYTVDQIAEMKGLPRGTVAGRLRAAKQKLGVAPPRANIKKRGRR
jgi:RNA polymerase sigma factor (sigma-70 family)